MHWFFSLVCSFTWLCTWTEVFQGVNLHLLVHLKLVRTRRQNITSLTRRQTIHLASCLESCELNYMHIWPIAASIHLCQDSFFCGISKPWLCYKPFLCNGFFFFFLLNNFRLYNAISTIKVTMENTSNRILAQILQVCFSYWGAFYLGNQVWRYLALMRGSGRINKSPNIPWSSCSPLK